jgi:hypothetical protein
MLNASEISAIYESLNRRSAVEAESPLAVAGGSNAEVAKVSYARRILYGAANAPGNGRRRHR